MYVKLLIDPVRRTVTVISNKIGNENVTLEMNRSEYNLFLAFCESGGQVLEKQMLIEQGWPGRVVGDNSLAVSIMKLRKKLDRLRLGFEINNLPGEGYVFVNTNNAKFEYRTDNPKFTSTNSDQGLNTPLEEQSDVASSDDEGLTHQSATRHERLYKLFKSSRFWEILLGLAIGAVLFFFVYREAFECFECFGGGGV